MRIVGLSSPPSDDKFDKPVFIELEPGKRQVIRNVEQALEALDANGWSSDGRKHRQARAASLDALLGLRKAAIARKAFQEAAFESDVLRDEDE